MNVLVTGGAGFIGSHVVERLLADGHSPRIFDLKKAHCLDGVEQVVGDLLDRRAVAAAAEGCQAIVHLAAVADVNDVLADPAHAEVVNVHGTELALEAARAAGVERFVFGSTIWVYGGANVDTTLDEDSPLELPTHPYTATKLAGEMLARSYAEIFGLPTTILRFGIPFGPRAREATVVASLVARARAGKALSVTGNGRQRRQFVYAGDLAGGIVAALAALPPGRIYNLVGNESTSVLEIAQSVRALIADVPIVHTPARKGDLEIGQVSGARAAAELGWRAVTSFDDGLRGYVEWLTETSGSPVAAAASRIDGNAETVLRHEAGEL